MAMQQMPLDVQLDDFAVFADDDAGHFVLETPADRASVTAR